MKHTSNTASKAERALPLIAVTAGEPAGIGPDLLVEIAMRKFDARLIAFTDPELLQERAAALGRAVVMHPVAVAGAAGRHAPGHLAVNPIALAEAATPGRPTAANAEHVLRCLRGAVQACLAQSCDALVTGPVNKAVINESGVAFSGHTEYLAGLCGGVFPVMMLMKESLRVALVTTHLPLADVCAAVTPDRLERTLRVLDSDLRTRFGIKRPRILVLGLNPHAGEQGYLGKEEQTVIAPVLATLRSEGLQLAGPAAADTAFTRESLRGVDAVLAMYHDQGLPALKALGFGAIVNVTLGLPIIRTSVDHGTALDLAASGKARSESLLAAIACAIELARRRRELPAPSGSPRGRRGAMRNASRR